MKRPVQIAREEATMRTLVTVTSSFEGIASMRISQIKSQVLQSTRFFQELWHIYSQLRVDNNFRFGREQTAEHQVINKEMYLLITAEGGFSGDIDQKLVQMMMQSYDPVKHDIVVIGRHGAQQLKGLGIEYRRHFALPRTDQNINAAPITEMAEQYKSTVVYYPEYMSLMDQQVRKIELTTAVKERGDVSADKDEIISEDNYIFEPSTYAVVAHLERSMMQIAVSQLILESKLAQYASRFRAMSAAHERAEDSRRGLQLDYNRAKRHIKDERLKEIMNGLKRVRIGSTA